jgi:hypothetical protein
MKLRRTPILAAAGTGLAAALIVAIPDAFASPPTGFADPVAASLRLPVGPPLHSSAHPQEGKWYG